MRKIRFYYDIVCPYSYMESRAVEAAEDAGEVEVEWLPFELRPAPQAAARAARRPPARRLDAARLPARAGARGRDPPAALPAALDAASSPPACGRPTRAGCGRSSTRSTRRSSARARTSRPTRRSAARPSGPGSTRTAAVAAAYSPERIARIAEIRREAEAAGVRGVPVAARPRTARPTGAWAASSACSPASRSSRAALTAPFEHGSRSLGTSVPTLIVKGPRVHEHALCRPRLRTRDHSRRTARIATWPRAVPSVLFVDTGLSADASHGPG